MVILDEGIPGWHQKRLPDGRDGGPAAVVPGSAQLARAVEDALAFVARQPGVREAEVFAAANRTLLTRLNYTSHIPCNGVEEPKSAETYGTRDPGRPRLPRRAPCSASARSRATSRSAGVRARPRQGAPGRRSRDPEFRSLPAAAAARRDARGLPRPRPAGRSTTRSSSRPAGRCSQGGLRAFIASSQARRACRRARRGCGLLGLILGGDVTIRPGVAWRSPRRRMPEPQTDESTLHHELRHGHGRGAERQGLRVVHRARASTHFTDEAGAEAAQRGDRRHRRRARAVRRLHGRLRPAARGRSPEQPRHPGLPRGRVLLVEHAVPRQARQAGRLPAPERLRPRRAPRAHGLQGHHVRGACRRGART